MENIFNPKETSENIINWISEWINTNTPNHMIVVGLSGGKDSTIVAALCAKAVGPENVIGVAMPGEGQSINDADQIAKHLGIHFMTCSIAELEKAYDNMFKSKDMSNTFNGIIMSEQTKMNIPPRLRMTTLYAVAQSVKGVVVNTCNLSEDSIGYSTLFGDCAGSFAPVRLLTATEIIQIGDELGLPKEWVHKTPDDGLPGSYPDEEKFGFTYKVLDDFIRGYANPSEEIEAKILDRNRKNAFKMNIVQIPAYPHYEGYINEKLMGL